MLFITGIAHSADKLKGLIWECIQKKLAGLVILVGNEYINAIPAELLEQADAADFPLFEMPWDVKLIDVTREITDLIMRDKFEVKKSKNFLGRLLFASDVDYQQMLDTAVINDIELLEHKFITIFNLGRPTAEAVEDAVHDSTEDKMQHSIDNLCKDNRIPVVTLVYGNNVICLVSAATTGQSRRGCCLYGNGPRAFKADLQRQRPLYQLWASLHGYRADQRQLSGSAESPFTVEKNEPCRAHRLLFALGTVPPAL